MGTFGNNVLLRFVNFFMKNSHNIQIHSIIYEQNLSILIPHS